MSQEQRIAKYGVHKTAACRDWCGGGEPAVAAARRWPAGSLGERFFSVMHLAEARHAPSLLTADVPAGWVIRTDPAHWRVATMALVRAVVYDGLRIDHPVVSWLLGVLAPVVEAELAYNEALERWPYDCWDEEEDEPQFPWMDGPVFLLGGGALSDAVAAVAGEGPLMEVHAVLSAALDGTVPGVAGQAVADVLVADLSTGARYKLPDDGDLRRRFWLPDGGCALECLAITRAMPSGDVLRAGLAILSVLAGLCRSRSASVLRTAA